MNNPSPLVPQGSLLEQKNKGRSRVKVAFFCVLGVHLVGLAVLLMQGCKREQPAPPEQPLPTITDSNVPPVEPSLPPATGSNTSVVPPTPPEPPIPQVPAATEYVVQKGDSFFSIGKKLGVSMKAIATANPGVDSTKLKPGQKLMIPAPAPATTATPGGTAPGMPVMSTGGTGEQSYTVKSGDNLSKIAAHFGTSVKAIQSANNLGTKTSIRVGEKLKIPAKAAAPAPAPAAAAPAEPPAPAEAPAAPATPPGR